MPIRYFREPTDDPFNQTYCDFSHKLKDRSGNIISDSKDAQTRTEDMLLTQDGSFRVTGHKYIGFRCREPIQGFYNREISKRDLK